MPTHTPPPPSPRKAGHPKLDPAIATRFRSICVALLNERFDGNVHALAEALDRTPATFFRFLDGRIDPSYETMTRLAQFLRVDVSEICRIPPEGPESSAIPSPRTQTLSAVYVMAQGARFDEAFIQQWNPTDPQERDPDKLWSECKEAHRVWKERRGDGGEKERRQRIRLYFRQVQSFGQRLGPPMGLMQKPTVSRVVPL